jgi:hypothetical protein
VKLQNDQRYALVVDTSKSTMYVFENHGGAARYVADYYISSGKKASTRSAKATRRRRSACTTSPAARRARSSRIFTARARSR